MKANKEKNCTYSMRSQNNGYKELKTYVTFDNSPTNVIIPNWIGYLCLLISIIFVVLILLIF